MARASSSPDLAALGALVQVAGHVASTRGGDLSYAAAKRAFRDLVMRDPMDSLFVTVLGGATLFYWAEKGNNPKCESFWDALVFITTCLSVGYDDVFARTDSGKAIASFVMTFGPALSGAAFDAPTADSPASAPSAPLPARDPEATAAASAESIALQKAILSRLDAILEALRAPSPHDTQSR